jgi:hypothetical protein
MFKLYVRWDRQGKDREGGEEVRGRKERRGGEEEEMRT